MPPSATPPGSTRSPLQQKAVDGSGGIAPDDPRGKPPTPEKQEATKLLPKGVERSDGAPPAAESKQQSAAPPKASTQEARTAKVVEAKSEGVSSPGLTRTLGDRVDVRMTNSACITTVGLLLMALAWCSGYYFREHQDAEDAARVSAVEARLVEGAAPMMNISMGGGTDGQCADGLFVGGPAATLGNALKFMMLLLWSFIGVAVFADLFMVSIERITSAEAVRRVVLPNGKTHTITTLTWNATIANLTLMALGSSAPEILLSVIEIMTSGFYAGELGACAPPSFDLGML